MNKNQLKNKEETTADNDKQIRADERKKVCELIIEKYNLRHEPKVEACGDIISYGYTMVNAKHLYNLLLEIEKGKTNE